MPASITYHMPQAAKPSGRPADDHRPNRAADLGSRASSSL